MKRQIMDTPIAIKNSRCFQKRTWQISVKQLVLNFDMYLHEVELGRALLITRRGVDLAVLLPVKKGLRHKPVNRKHRAWIPRRAAKKW